MKLDHTSKSLPLSLLFNDWCVCRLQSLTLWAFVSLCYPCHVLLVSSSKTDFPNLPSPLDQNQLHPGFIFLYICSWNCAQCSRKELSDALYIEFNISLSLLTWLYWTFPSLESDCYRPKSLTLYLYLWCFSLYLFFIFLKCVNFHVMPWTTFVLNWTSLRYQNNIVIATSVLLS